MESITKDQFQKILIEIITKIILSEEKLPDWLGKCSIRETRNSVRIMSTSDTGKSTDETFRFVENLCNYSCLNSIITLVPVWCTLESATFLLKLSTSDRVSTISSIANSKELFNFGCICSTMFRELTDIDSIVQITEIAISANWVESKVDITKLMVPQLAEDVLIDNYQQLFDELSKVELLELIPEICFHCKSRLLRVILDQDRFKSLSEENVKYILAALLIAFDSYFNTYWCDGSGVIQEGMCTYLLDSHLLDSNTFLPIHQSFDNSFCEKILQKFAKAIESFCFNEELFVLRWCLMDRNFLDHIPFSKREEIFDYLGNQIINPEFIKKVIHHSDDKKISQMRKKFELDYLASKYINFYPDDIGSIEYFLTSGMISIEDMIRTCCLHANYFKSRIISEAIVFDYGLTKINRSGNEMHLVSQYTKDHPVRVRFENRKIYVVSSREIPGLQQVNDYLYVQDEQIENLMRWTNNIVRETMMANSHKSAKFTIDN